MPDRPVRRYQAVEAFVSWIRSSPSIRHGRVTVKAWDGRTGADDPPTPASCPWIRLSDHGGPWTPSHAYGWETPVFIRVETAVKGLASAPSYQLWDALTEAIYGGDADAVAARAALWADAGISNVLVLQPAEGVADPSEAARYPGLIYSARGLLRLDLYTEF
jgi:hypothetical protein